MHHKSIYIASVEPRAGSLVVAIGIMEMLKGRYSKVAFFRPVVPDNEELNNDIAFMLEHFQLDMRYEECYGFTVSQYSEAYSNNSEDKLHEALLKKVEDFYKTHDFVLMEGYARNAFDTFFDFDINLEIAKNLDTVFVPIVNARGKSASKILTEIQITSELVQEEGCTLLSVIVNRCDETIIPTLKKNIETLNSDDQIYILPEIKELNTPTVGQVAKAFNATRLLGEDSQLEHLVYGNKIAAMGVVNYLFHINDGDIVIVPGDRVDIILVSMLSFYSKNHTNIAAIILSGGITPSEAILELLNDFPKTVIPIFSVQLDSYETAIALNAISAEITPENTRKITLAKGVFNAAIDKEKLSQRFRTASSNTLTPIMFQYRIFEQARKQRKKIILPESEDERILRAAEILLHRNIVDIILLGKAEEIDARCKQMDLNISRAEIIDPDDKVLKEHLSQLFYQMRKEKGLKLDIARDALSHVSYFATMMIHEGMADGMVSGATHTTADTIRPALQIIKTKADISIVSSIFFMCLETKVLVYGDCAVNMDPGAEELAQIAVSSADTAKAFGIEPRVALLSYSTGSSGTGPEVEKVRKATQLAQKMRPGYLIEGPMQYDAAIDTKVAKKKLPESQVAGRATVFIFPDLNTGNNTYKAVQRSTGALAIGPVLQGLRLPVNDLSRGCLVDDIVNTVAITAIQAQEN